jgi:phosphoribosyl-AMP cyclohydrolase
MSAEYFQRAEAAAKGCHLDLALTLGHLNYNAEGLIPVITQDYRNKNVLMMAWMNAQALAVTLQEQYVCYWSRSRQTLWRKGETSGHRQKLVELRIDCDGDCLLCWVEQQGPACHTGRSNCFYFRANAHSVEVLEDAPNPAFPQG